MMKNTQSLVLKPNEGLEIAAGTSKIIFKLLSEATGNRFSITEYDLPPFFPGPPPHKHRMFEHAWYVLAGEVTVIVDDDDFVLPSGGFAFIPKKRVHSFANRSAVPAKLLAIDTPGGFENYYIDLQKATQDGKELAPETIRSIQLKYDTFPPAYLFDDEIGKAAIEELKHKC